MFGALYNRDLECSAVDSVVKEQIRITGDKCNSVPRSYLNMEVAVFWVVALCAFVRT
jgi:hypothetical protein